jgi:hypothetical protein
MTFFGKGAIAASMGIGNSLPDILKFLSDSVRMVKGDSAQNLPPFWVHN